MHESDTAVVAGCERAHYCRMPWRGTEMLLGVCGALISSISDAAPLNVTFRGTVPITQTSTLDQHGTGFSIAGLSGITHRSGDEYLAVMDNSNKLVRLSIAFGANGAITGVSVLGGYSLPQSHDFEGIAYMGAVRNTVLLSEEGTPGVREFSLESQGFPFAGMLSVPTVFANRRANFGLEGLTVWASPAARSLSGSAPECIYFCNEEALTVDGAASSQSAGTDVRISCVQRLGAADSSVWQHAYRTQPWHGSAISGARSGVADLVALSDGRLIVLERSFAFSFSGLFQARLYEVDCNAATEVGDLALLEGQSFTRITKRLLWSGDVANLEGLALGPRLLNGNHALVGIVDDGDPVSNNTVMSWELSGVVTPCAADFDWSGAVTADDIFLFLDAWFAQQGRIGVGLPADFDENGGVTADDIFVFLDVWFGACD